MTCELFIEKKFQRKTLAIIATADEIIREYRAQGFILTLRQLYYQFVARDLLTNTEQSYNRLGSIVNDARLAGLLDWDAIEDRTRNLDKNLHLDSPAHAVNVIRDQYGIDMWENQDVRCEVWIEKEALAGVIEAVCRELDCPFFACRGYVSQSEQWRAGVRFRRDQTTVVIHLGDHDPSGIDMTRDNLDRLRMFAGYHQVIVNRIALNMDQIDEYNPPPNPAKQTDSRFDEYSRLYGDESWELDALEPSVITELIRTEVDKHRDPDLWEIKSDELADDIEALDRIIEDLQS